MPSIPILTVSAYVLLGELLDTLAVKQEELSEVERDELSCDEAAEVFVLLLAGRSDARNPYRVLVRPLVELHILLVTTTVLTLIREVPIADDLQSLHFVFPHDFDADRHAALLNGLSV